MELDRCMKIPGNRCCYSTAPTYVGGDRDDKERSQEDIFRGEEPWVYLDRRVKDINVAIPHLPHASVEVGAIKATAKKSVRNSSDNFARSPGRRPRRARRIQARPTRSSSRRARTE